MADKSRSTIIEENPIGKGLNVFRSSFNSVCEDRSISCTPDALGQLGHDGNAAQLRRSTLLTIMQISAISHSFFFPLYKAFLSQGCSFRRQVVAPFEAISEFATQISGTTEEAVPRYCGNGESESSARNHEVVPPQPVLERYVAVRLASRLQG